MQKKTICVIFSPKNELSEDIKLKLGESYNTLSNRNQIIRNLDRQEP